MLVRAEQVITFYAGSAEDVIIPLTDSAEPPAPIPDLTGWTGLAQVRYSYDHPDVLASWSTTDNTLALADSSARLRVGADMALASLAWPWRLARFDVRLTSPPGQGSLPNRPIRGIIRVIPGITQ
jgi:hypothetical protein